MPLEKPGWFLIAHVMNFFDSCMSGFIWSIFLVPGTLLSDLPYSPNLTSHLLQQCCLCSPDLVLHSPRDNSFLVARDSPLLPLFFLPEKLSLFLALSSTFQVRCSKRPLLPVPAQPAFQLCEFQLELPRLALHCVLDCRALALCPGAFPMSAKGQPL